MVCFILLQGPDLRYLVHSSENIKSYRTKLDNDFDRLYEKNFKIEVKSLDRQTLNHFEFRLVNEFIERVKQNLSMLKF